MMLNRSVLASACRSACLYSAPSVDDGSGRSLGIILGRCPGADRQSHDPVSLPLRAGSKADPVGLHLLDHATCQCVALGSGPIGPKSNCRLIQDDIVLDIDPRLLRETPGHSPRDRTIACDELCNPFAPECTDHR